MDLGIQRTEHSTAVPPDWGFARGSVLRSGAGDSREFAIDAPNRRAVHKDAVLWSPEDELVARRARIRSQSETSAPTDAADGAGGDLPEASAVEAGPRASNLPVPAARNEDRSAQSGVDQRHHVHSTAARLHLSGRGHGLVQPLRSGLANIGFLGDIVLRGGAGLGATARAAEHLQHGSRIAVHQRGLHEPATDSWHRYQHGWARPRDRQHLHRTVVANGEIRGGLSEGLRGRIGSAIEPESVFQFLQ